MKKFYNIVLIILVVSEIIVGLLIFNKYHNNYLNEQKIDEKIEQLEKRLEELERLDDFEEVPSLEETYEGYEIDGIIEIPKIDIKYPILKITNDATMKISVTKFWGSKLNEYGNYSIAGHNNKDGTLFGKTKKLEIGDKIFITDLKGKTIEYEIYDRLIVDPNDTSITKTNDETIREITLITCTNGRNNRLILKAKEIINLKGEF